MNTRIEAYLHKWFDWLQLDVGPSQVIVDRNRAGKSTLLDIPAMLGEMLENRSIEKAFFDSRDWFAPRASTARDLVFGGKGEWFAFAIEVQLLEALASQLERARDRATKLGGRKTGRPIFRGISKRACDLGNEDRFRTLRTALETWFPTEDGGSA